MASSEPPTESAAIPTSEQVAEPAEIQAEDTLTASVETTAAVEVSPADDKDNNLEEIKAKWPGWPGYTVFRLVVPVLKVGSIIGRKGDIIKKLVEETRARVRVLDGPASSSDRIVLISGKEEPEAALSPAMDAILRVYRRVNGLPENDADINATGAAFCSMRLLVASTQAISLIGKQGSLIKSIQESSGASVRVLSNDDVPTYASSEERVVELQGEALKVLKALEAVVGHLRKFLVDQSVLPLFEKSYNVPATQERQVDAWSDKTSLHVTPQTSLGADYSVSAKRDSLFMNRESQIESHIAPSRLSLYGTELGLGNHSSIIGRSGGPIVTQVVQTMQIPLAYAEDIIGIRGTNIEYIRGSTGAILTVHESTPEQITVEIKGTSSQVQAAQQLIQEFIGVQRREPLPGSYGKLESSYPRLGSSSSYLSSSYSGQPYGGYGSSGAGGYSFRP
ncbi:hypothetical protein ACS0TY_016511 [Phlomoides rotata]